MSGGYTVEDKGLLVAPMKRFIWDPLLKRLPMGLSANAMTLTGTALNLTAATIALLVPTTRSSVAVVAALIFIYLCLDNMDGAQARRTGTGSPLGEFLDHWLDSINGPYLSLGALVCWYSENLRGLLAIAMTSTAVSITYWEQRATGRLYFGRLGNVEGISGVIFFLAVQAIVGPATLARFPLAFGYALTDLFVLLTVVTGAITSIAPMVRARSHITNLRVLVPVLALFAGPLAMVAWYIVGDLPFKPATGLVVLLTPASGGRMLMARLTQQPKLGPDYALILPVVLSAAACVALRPAPETQEALLVALVAYAIVKVSFDFLSAIRRLSHHIRPGELLSLTIGKRRS